MTLLFPARTPECTTPASDAPSLLSCALVLYLLLNSDLIISLLLVSMGLFVVNFGLFLAVSAVATVAKVCLLVTSHPDPDLLLQAEIDRTRVEHIQCMCKNDIAWNYNMKFKCLAKLLMDVYAGTVCPCECVLPALVSVTDCLIFFLSSSSPVGPSGICLYPPPASKTWKPIV